MPLIHISLERCASECIAMVTLVSGERVNRGYALPENTTRHTRVSLASFFFFYFATCVKTTVSCRVEWLSAGVSSVFNFG